MRIRVVMLLHVVLACCVHVGLAQVSSKVGSRDCLLSTSDWYESESYWLQLDGKSAFVSGRHQAYLTTAKKMCENCFTPGATLLQLNSRQEIEKWRVLLRDKDILLIRGAWVATTPAVRQYYTAKAADNSAEGSDCYYITEMGYDHCCHHCRSSSINWICEGYDSYTSWSVTAGVQNATVTFAKAFAAAKYLLKATRKIDGHGTVQEIQGTSALTYTVVLSLVGGLDYDIDLDIYNRNADGDDQILGNFKQLTVKPTCSALNEANTACGRAYCGNCGTCEGHCEILCEIGTRVCKPSVCDFWYVPPLCTKPIVVPNITTNEVQVKWRKSDSVDIAFEQMMLGENETMLYLYVVRYWLMGLSNDSSGILSKNVQPTANGTMLLVSLDELRSNTAYGYQIIPFRTYLNVTEAGNATEEYSFLTECDTGFYGQHCDRECGHCKSGFCHRSGDCLCDKWWAPPHCSIPIARPSLANGTIRLSPGPSPLSDVKVEYDQLDLNDTQYDHYIYIVQYKEVGKNYEHLTPVLHKGKLTKRDALIDTLQPGREYRIRVLPVRKDILSRLEDAGEPTEELTITTPCTDGKYGYTCSQKCHCRSGACDLKSGHCASQKCQDWWISESCSVWIAQPSWEQTNVSVTVTETSLRVTFLALNVSEPLWGYYGYVVEYAPEITGDDSRYDVANLTLPHNTSGYVEVSIGGLMPGVKYTVRVVPFRKDIRNGLQQDARATDRAVVTTVVEPSSGATASAETIVPSVLSSVAVLALLVAAGGILYRKKTAVKLDASPPKFSPMGDPCSDKELQQSNQMIRVE